MVVYRAVSASSFVTKFLFCTVLCWLVTFRATGYQWTDEWHVDVTASTDVEGWQYAKVGKLCRVTARFSLLY